jgi:mannose-6-phosphate isomerase-like protein (cupin superfamily)
MNATAIRNVLGPSEGEQVRLMALGVRFMIDGEMTGGRFSLVEHPLPARRLGAPMHTHSREDEYSFILEGRVGIQLGDEVLQAGPGDLVFKPRGVPHTFWNAGDSDARLLELISPAGFEHYFRELAPVLAEEGPGGPGVGAVRERYGLELDPASVAILAAAHNLVLG